jgi:hypothetical protein
MKINCPGEYLNFIVDMGSHVLELSTEHEFMKLYIIIIIIIFISIDPNTEYKGCGKVIHKRTTVQMHYVSRNNIKTKTCKQYKIKLNLSYYYIQNTL